MTSKTSAQIPKILVIEDDVRIRRFLRAALTTAGHRVHEAGTASQGWIEATTRQPDVILLDLGLPDGDGLDLIRQIRDSRHDVPILVISVRGYEGDKIAALDAGAEDFVTKPFSSGELLARVRVALRRHTTGGNPGREKSICIGNIEMDLESRIVRVSGREVHLTRTEYKILQILARHADKVLTHRELLNMVWGPHYVDQTHYLRAYMGLLRRKLEADPTRPRHIRTEPGVGYRLVT